MSGANESVGNPQTSGGSNPITLTIPQLTTSAEESPVPPETESSKETLVPETPIEQMLIACKQLKTTYINRIDSLKTRNIALPKQIQSDQSMIREITKIENTIKIMSENPNHLSKLKDLAEKNESLDFSFYSSFRPYFVLLKMPEISYDLFNGFLGQIDTLQETIQKFKHLLECDKNNNNAAVLLAQVINLDLFDNIKTSASAKTGNHRFLQLEMILADLKIAHDQLIPNDHKSLSYFNQQIEQLIENGTQIVNLAKKNAFEKIQFIEDLKLFLPENNVDPIIIRENAPKTENVETYSAQMKKDKASKYRLFTLPVEHNNENNKIKNTQTATPGKKQ